MLSKTSEEANIIQKKQIPLKKIEEYYRDFFSYFSAANLERWSGAVRSLNGLLSEEEVKAATKKLNNNRAVGSDGLPAVYFKHAGWGAYLRGSITAPQQNI